jgi:hypothetical protein
MKIFFLLDVGDALVLGRFGSYHEATLFCLQFVLGIARASRSGSASTDANGSSRAFVRGKKLATANASTVIPNDHAKV